MNHDEAVYSELRDISENLGFIRGTLNGIDARLDNVEGLYSKVQEIEKSGAKHTGYIKGIYAAVTFLFALIGVLSAFMIL